MEAASFQSIVTQLTAGQTPRVWSLLVTIFGELAQEKGAQISGLMLTHMRALIGIKPEAMRVALHRLRKDGWIENRRTGRTSAYYLTDWGRAQSGEASPRIYSPAPAADQAWLILSDPNRPQSDSSLHGTWLTSNLVLSIDAPPPSDAFVTPLTAETTLPDWMRNKVCDAETLAKSIAFADTLETVKRQLNVLPELSVLESAVFRILLVHAWRRIVLKSPVLPDFVFPVDWCGPQCRQNVSDLLTSFPKCSLAELEAAMRPV
ncbi:MAG: PaaX family transcriptional regulator C-terminal domain-containing protein [Sulfitobacter sp.]